MPISVCIIFTLLCISLQYVLMLSLEMPQRTQRDYLIIAYADWIKISVPSEQRLFFSLFPFTLDTFPFLGGLLGLKLTGQL